MSYIRSTIRMIRKAVSVLPQDCQSRFWWMMCVVSLSAVLEALATVSLGPFLAIVTQPQRVWGHEQAAVFLNRVGVRTDTQLIVVAGVVLIIAMLLANVGKACLLRTRLHFDDELTRRISVHTFSRYLAQPFEFFVTKNTADIQRFITQEALYLVLNVFDPILIIFERCLVAIVLCTIVASIEPVVALVIAAGLLTVYTAIAVINRRRFGSLGNRMRKAKRISFFFVKEVLGSIKLVKLRSVEKQVLQRYDRQLTVFTNGRAEVAIRGALPRFALEVAGVTIIASVTIYFALRPGGLESGVPLLGLYGFAFYRLLPGFQLVFANLAKVMAAQANLDEYQRELASFISPDDLQTRPEEVNKITVRAEGAVAVEFRSVHYRYPNTFQDALREVSFQIPASSTVGIVGKTGAGKTTLLNVLLGLLHPQAGEVLVFGQTLTINNCRNWRELVGFVPQDITLFDATIAENIAFVIDSDKIDMDRVKTAARLAAIHEFIEAELPNGYDTRVGDNGIRFSGGQRQRIAIARALYHDPPVLIFDEATSNLDTATEAEFMKAFERLQGTRTIIVVAHRLATIEKCDQVLQLSDATVSPLPQDPDPTVDLSSLNKASA